MDWLIIRAVRFHIGWNSVGILLYQSGHCWYSSPISDMKFSNWQSLGGCNRCEMINLSNSSDQVHKSKEPLLTLASYRRNKVAHDIYILVPIISGKPICTIKHHFVQFLLNQLKDLKNARGHRKMRTCKILVQLVFPFRGASMKLTKFWWYPFNSQWTTTYPEMYGYISSFSKYQIAYLSPTHPPR